jgi:predicted nuclease of predicted toxin-antitoxin system
MIRFLIDEDMPRSTAKALKRVGFECFDVRDIGLKGAEDDVIYAWA